MQYPLISEYVRAIQDAGSNLDKLAHLEPVADKHGEPYRSSGAFAVVFKMRDPKTGRCYALKCFTEEQEGRAEAYRRIADELETVDSTYLTTVKYYEGELFVDSPCDDDCFPVLLMDWIEGETMEAYIAAHWRDTYAMSMLCYRFCRMAAWLRSQPFAHGDIKPDNVMVREDGTLALVDYDGMFVPSMKGQKSPTIGTKDFSHPLRTVDDFDETIDDFTLSSIALSLKAMSLDLTLREKYGAADRLLFSVNDYRDLGKSAVLAALQPLLADADLATLLSQFLLAWSKKDLSQASFRLFTLPKPSEPENLRTNVTEADLAEAITDEYGVKYSPDGLRLLKAPDYRLQGVYQIKPGTKVICDEAFGECRLLTSIIIPASVKEMRGNPFCGWNGELICGWDGELINKSPYFTYEEGVLFSKGKNRIIAFRRQNTTSYVIPNGVSSIGDGAFYGCESLTNITIPDSVTSIGNGAFGWCSSLASITIPDSVTSIGDRAFEGCWSLSDITIPSSVSNIGDGAFGRCSSLASIAISDGVTSIGDGAFSGCKSLTRVAIPDGVTSIGDGAFWWCSSLASITIPDSVTSIGDGAFYWCTSLTSVIIPDGVTSIGDGAFRGCLSLTSITIPDGVTSIGDYAFSDCKSLTNIVFPDSVTSIGNGAFYRCTSLTSIIIPSSVRKIIGNPFFSWHGELINKSPHFIYDDNVLFSKNKDKIIAFRQQGATAYVIPDGVMCIGERAFGKCSSLTSITIPDSVTSIGYGALEHCSLYRVSQFPTA